MCSVHVGVACVCVCGGGGGGRSPMYVCDRGVCVGCEGLWVVD